MMAFSSGGRFFACATFGSWIYLWKESPTGYNFHRRLAYDGVGVKRCILSPDGQSILACDEETVQLWRTLDSSCSPFSIPTGDLHPPDRFIIGFSPDGLLAAVARLDSEDDTVTVLDLKSGTTRLIIDGGGRIRGLGIAGSTVVVVAADREAVTWKLPIGAHALSTRVDREDSIRMAELDRSGTAWKYVSVSPDLNYIVATDEYGSFSSWGVSTGILIMSTWIGMQPHSILWFTSDGRELWVPDESGIGEAGGWAVVGNDEFDIIKLKPLNPTKGPSGGLPWRSPHGCQVTDDGWVLNSTGKRLLWLPAWWRSRPCDVDGVNRAWSGRFLTLLHSGLPEVVVLELLVE